MKLIDKIEVGKDIYGCPDAMIPIVAAQLASEHGQAIYIARDDARMSSLIRSLEFIAPQIETLALPAWDCLPYDRVSPHPDIVSRRIACLSRLVALHNTEGTSHKQPILLVTTINSWLQKIPHPAFFDGASLRLTEQMQISQKQVIDFLTANGFFRTSTVREFGEFSVRGGIIDIYCSTEHDPVRLDFFGDEIDSLKYFDSLSQKSISAAAEINILPAQEFILDEETISR
ncbi:MAG: transcription-repair coupling factor, partial [Candidatus Puniceispirillaceae bacterium]